MFFSMGTYIYGGGYTYFIQLSIYTYFLHQFRKIIPSLGVTKIHSRPFAFWDIFLPEDPFHTAYIGFDCYKLHIRQVVDVYRFQF